MLINPYIYAPTTASEFKMTIDTTETGGTTPADTFMLRLAVGPTNFTIYWGDGNSDVITTYNQAELTHVYAAGGSYQISIDGSFYGLNNGYADDGKMMSIDNWGTNVWGTCAGAFFYCDKLVANYSDTPDFSQVTNFSVMFQYCSLFNGSVDDWDTSSAIYMSSMFWLASAFNQPIAFDTSNVIDMSSMFRQSAFNQIINFDGSSLINATNMFISAPSMNSSVTITNSTLLENCSGMFSQMSSFNSAVTLTTTSVTNMSNMFAYSNAFNTEPRFNGGTSNVTTMSSMFINNLVFNHVLGFISDTSNVISMAGMFYNCYAFNQSVSGFNTSNVTSMFAMFQNCSVFNQPVPFDTGNVTNMQAMFFSCQQLNQAINFNTVNVNTMYGMFINCSQLISATLSDTSNVTTMLNMFAGTGTFNQDISSWNITSLTTASGMFSGNNGFSTTNYDLLLPAWDAYGTSSVPFHAGTAQYSAGAPATAHANMISRSWTITDGGPV